MSDPAGSRAETPAGGLSYPPQTGDLVIDASLTDLAATDHEDLGAQLEAGERVDQTLRARLADLGG